MTPDQMRVAIAEEQGLHVYTCSDPWDGSCDVCERYAPDARHKIPNYPSDLNAWRGILTREKLTQEQIVTLLNTLRKLVGERFGIEKPSDFDMLAAVIDHTELFCEAYCRMKFPERFKQ